MVSNTRTVVQRLDACRTAAPPGVAADGRFGARDWALFVAGAAVNLLAVGRLVAQVVAAPHHLDGASLLVLAPGALAIVAFEARWFSLPLMRAPVPLDPEPGLRVAVVTTFVPAVEPVAMLRRTVRALVAMDYAHDTWVLDEGDDPAVRAMCDELGARHFTRHGVERYHQPSGPFETRCKHGNYNAWLDAVGYDGYEVIVGFDPDHIPKPEFLERTLGYLTDERIGYVQAPQLYYNQPAGWIARGAAEETYAYYSSVQMTSYALGYPIVTGCHTVHRTAALREVGGYAPHEADDLLITVLYRAAGWEGVYVPEMLAAGLTPTDWRGYLGQQRRWARSVLDVKLRAFRRVAGDLPVTERVVAALHGLYYLYGISTALGIGVLSVGLATGRRPPVLTGAVAFRALVLWGVLTGCELFRQRFYLDRRTEWGLHLRAAFLKYAKWPYVLLACWDARTPRAEGFATTPKVRLPGRRLLVVPHGAVIALVLASAAVGEWCGHPVSPLLAGPAALVVALSAAAIASEHADAPDPYDDTLAAARVPWSMQEP